MLNHKLRLGSGHESLTMSWLIEVAKNPRFVRLETKLLEARASHSLGERAALEAVRTGYMTKKNARIVFLQFTPAFMYQVLFFGTVFMAIYL